MHQSILEAVATIGVKLWIQAFQIRSYTQMLVLTPSNLIG